MKLLQITLFLLYLIVLCQAFDSPPSEANLPIRECDEEKREKYRRSRRTIGTNRRNNPGQCVSYGREVSEGHRDVRQLNSGMDYPQIHFVCYDMYVFTLKNKLKTQF